MRSLSSPAGSARPALGLGACGLLNLWRLVLGTGENWGNERNDLVALLEDVSELENRLNVLGSLRLVHEPLLHCRALLDDRLLILCVGIRSCRVSCWRGDLRGPYWPCPEAGLWEARSMRARRR